MMGKQLALHALGGEGAREAWPATPLGPIPCHGLRPQIGHLMRGYYTIRDRLDRRAA